MELEMKRVPPIPENEFDKIAHGRRRVMSDEEVWALRHRYATEEIHVRALSRELGISRPTIKAALMGKGAYKNV